MNGNHKKTMDNFAKRFSVSNAFIYNENENPRPLSLRVFVSGDGKKFGGKFVLMHASGAFESWVPMQCILSPRIETH